MSNKARLLMYLLCVYPCTRASLLWVTCAGKGQRGKLMHWLEKASFEKIRRLLEISEGVAS